MKSRKIKIFSVFSNIEFANEFFWYAKYLDKDKFNLICVFLNEKTSPLQEIFNSYQITTHFIRYSGKKSILSASLKLAYLLLKHQPDIIHPQLFDASFITLTIARILTFKKRIYTRHHSDYHHVYHPKAVKYDKWINKCAKKIICPSQQTKRILIEKENVPEKKIVAITHAFDFSSFTINLKDEFKKKYNLNGNPIIGVVSRFTEWKGVQYTIPAFKKLLNTHNNALLVLAGTKGNYENEIKKLLSEIPNKQYRIIEFEPEIYSLIANFNIFVHVPIYIEAETFGQVYVESFALGIPSIITLSGIASEDDIFRKYAEVVNYKDTEAIYNAMIKIMSNYEHYIAQMSLAKEEIYKKYDFKNKIEAIENLYLELMSKYK